jgi:hypothetical protein
MQFRARLNKKIVELTLSEGLTHTQLASKSDAYRTRIPAILNGQKMGVSTDFLLRILSAPGCSADLFHHPDRGLNGHPAQLQCLFAGARFKRLLMLHRDTGFRVEARFAPPSRPGEAGEKCRSNGKKPFSGRPQGGARALSVQKRGPPGRR